MQMNKHPPTTTHARMHACTHTNTSTTKGWSLYFQTDMNLSQSLDDNFEVRLVDGSGFEMTAITSDCK